MLLLIYFDRAPLGAAADIWASMSFIVCMASMYLSSAASSNCSNTALSCALKSACISSSSALPFSVVLNHTVRRFSFWRVRSINPLSSSWFSTVVTCCFCISVRAAKGVDACAIARRLGGGGHTRAAGCELLGNLDNTKSAILAEVEAVLDAPQEGA